MARNDRSYYLKPGYLHRYFLTFDPLWMRADDISTAEQERVIREQIKEFRQKEDAALTDFSSLFSEENPNPENGILILNSLLTDSNVVFDSIWKEISTKGVKSAGIEKKMKDISKEALHEKALSGLDELLKEENKENKEIIRQIKGNITREINNLLQPQGGMKFSKKAATLGNWFERYYAVSVYVAYLNKLLREQSDLQGWKHAMAVAGTISHFSGKELLSAQTGDSKYGLKESTYDILFAAEKENPLPVQMKASTTTDRKILSLPPTSLDLLLDETVNSSVSDIIRFAIIHQHAFSDPNYILLVNTVNEDRIVRGIKPVNTYKPGSNPSAIEKLNANPSGLLDAKFINVINVLRYAIAVKVVAGIAEGKEALMYVISKTGTKTRGHTRDAVLRVSDMLEYFLSTSSKISSNPWSVKQTKDSFGSVPDNILKLYEEEPLETRQEWYDATSAQVLSAVNKIKLSMEFNYANIGG